MEFQLTGRLDELGRIQCVQANCTGTQGAPGLPQASGCLEPADRELLQRKLDYKVDECAALMVQLGELSKRAELQEKLLAHYEVKFKRQDKKIKELTRDRNNSLKEVGNISNEHANELLREEEESTDSNATCLAEGLREHVGDTEKDVDVTANADGTSDTKTDKAKGCKNYKCSYGIDSVDSGWRTFSYTESFTRTRTSVTEVNHLSTSQCCCPRFDDGEAIHCTWKTFNRDMRMLEAEEKKMSSRTEGDGSDEVDGQVGQDDQQEQKEGVDDVDGVNRHHICKAPSAVKTEMKEQDHSLPLHCTTSGHYVEIPEEDIPVSADVICTSEAETQNFSRYHRDGYEISNNRSAPRLPERSPRRLSGANVPEDLVARVNGTKDWIDAMKVLQNLFNFSEEGAEENLRIILKDCNTVFTIELKETYSLVKNSSSRNERIKMFRKKLGKRYGPGVLKRIEHYIMECINVCSNRISTSK